MVQSCEFLRSFLATGFVAQKRSMSGRISVAWQPFNGVRLGCTIFPEKLCWAVRCEGAVGPPMHIKSVIKSGRAE